MFHSQEEFWNHLHSNSRFFRGKILFATNLEYDMGILLNDREEEKDINLMWRGGRLIVGKFKLKNGRSVRFSDTMNFSPTSVERLGDLIGIPKMPKPRSWSPQSKEELDYLTQYNIQDSKITYSFMNYLKKGLSSIGADIKLTASSTSLNAWKNNYWQKDLEPSNFIKEEHNSYFGGRCEAFKRGICKGVKVYDFNSMYPAVMAVNEFPLVDTAKRSYDPKLESEGISYVSIKVPGDLNIPLLPIKTDKLYFPIGTFKGWYTHVELRKAKEIGYKIDVHKSIVYKTDELFRQYILDLYKLRNQYKKSGNEIMQLCTKLLMNSLYGKFATKLEVFNAVHKSKVSHDELVDYLEAGHQLAGDYLHYTSDMEHTPKYVMPIVSSYITAYSRLKLYDSYEKVGFNNVLYSDTDSLMTTKVLPEGLELGKLSLEYSGDVTIVRPKVYMRGDGMIKVKGLGRVIKTPSDFKQYIINGGTVQYDRFCKIKEGRRRGFYYGEKIKCHKTTDPEDNKRVWKHSFNSDCLQESVPITFKNGMSMVDIEKLQREAVKAYDDYQGMMEDAFIKSDLFDSHSVGNDISSKEFLSNEKWFGRHI